MPRITTRRVIGRWRTVRVHPSEHYPFGDVPRRAGLYAIYIDDLQVVYLGMSRVDVANRVATHIKRQPDGRFWVPPGTLVWADAITIKVSVGRPPHTLREVERRLIGRINPYGNTQDLRGDPMFWKYLDRNNPYREVAS